MNRATTWLMALVIGCGFHVRASVPDIMDGFESYDLGANFFDTPIGGWNASGRSVLVTNTGAYTGKAVIMNGSSSLTNAMGGGVGSARIWTEVMVNPVVGEDPPSPPTNSASFGCYFNGSGCLIVYAAGQGTLVCSNDVWGQAVPPATNGYVRVTVYQDYGQSKEAVFLNGQLLLQDLPFVGTATDYNKLLVNNPDNNAWLDDVWIRSSHNASVLTNDFNHDGLADAQEMADYHYVARTLYVGGPGFPAYGTIQAAVDVARPRDVIYVYAGSYNETVTLVTNVRFSGMAFSLSGLQVSVGATIDFAQQVSVDTATVNGWMNFANGTTCSVASLLSIGDAGGLNFASNSTFIASYTGVQMTGGFAISNTWNKAVTKKLPFKDDFERYADGSVLANLSFEGWYANSSQIQVVAGMGRNASKGVRLPGCTTLSNRIDKTDAIKIWTDFQLMPSWGAIPSDFPTNSASFAAYVNEEGRLVVCTNGGFKVCSNAWDGSVLTPLSSNQFTRITIFQNMTESKYALFIGGQLVLEQAMFPGGHDYRSLRVDNREGDTRLDEIVIASDMPEGLASLEAREIASYGTTTLHGSVYLMR